MLLQISYQSGLEEYLDVVRLDMNQREKWIRFFPEFAEEGEEYGQVNDETWDEIKTIYINNRIAYARPADRFKEIDNDQRC